MPTSTDAGQLLLSLDPIPLLSPHARYGVAALQAAGRDCVRRRAVPFEADLARAIERVTRRQALVDPEVATDWYGRCLPGYGNPGESNGPHRNSEMSNEVRLRSVEPEDLPIFFEQQLDPDATRMADIPSRNREAFDAHWDKYIFGNPSSITRTILVGGQVAGHIGSWRQGEARLVGYWTGREYWGRGVATRGLAEFVGFLTERPLYAHVVRHNVASIRVLEKCGFSLEGEERVDEGGEEITELVFVLR